MRLISATVWAMAAASAAIAQPCTPGWHSVGGGTNHVVGGMAVFREQGHDNLIIGGFFGSVGGLPIQVVARWNGFQWTAVGDVRFNRSVFTMRTYDDGSGSKLYVAGALEPVPGFDSHGIARWDGQTWSATGDGLIPTPNWGIYALEVFDDGSGSALYAGGGFTVPGQPSGSPFNLARWDGTAWTLVAGADHIIRGLLAHDDGSGPALYVAGAFENIAGIAAGGAARWDGQTWQGMRGNWHSLAAWDFAAFSSGGQTQLYLTGSHYGGTPLVQQALSRWDGTNWVVVAVANDHVVRAFVWDDGSGPALIVGGSFTQINGLPIRSVARYDGQSWTGLGGGYAPGGQASRFCYFENDPAGPSLYVSGNLSVLEPGGGRGIARYTTCHTPSPPCYANCDGSTVGPILNVDDFICFISEFAAGTALPHAQQLDHYANCDDSTVAPVLNVDDFTCFVNAFATGCP